MEKKNKEAESVQVFFLEVMRHLKHFHHRFCKLSHKNGMSQESIQKEKKSFGWKYFPKSLRYGSATTYNQGWKRA